MASIAPPRTTLADFGGKHLENNKLVNVQYEPYTHPSEGTSNGNGEAGSRPPALTNGDKDGAAGLADDPEDDEEEPEIMPPSRGYGKGKGKRPAIRFEPAADDDSQSDDEISIASRETGLRSRKQSIQLMTPTPVKKRTFSNVSNTSLLFGDEPTFPRPKIARKLSHADGTGLLTYTTADHEGTDHAIESSDDEKEENRATEDDDEDYSALNQIMDDDSDVEKVEEEEESFIIHDEIQHATSLFSTNFDDARRPSLDSFGSDDLFTFEDYFPVPGEEEYFATAGDMGFGDFFAPVEEDGEPKEDTTSAEDQLSLQRASRKLSDSSAKRVRFDDEVNMSESSSSSSDELDNSLFPDLFMEQDKLPRIIYQQLQMDTEDETDDEFPSSASEQSFFRFERDETRSNTRKNMGLSAEVDDSSSEAGSSGYETDMGDTTDEYDSEGESMPAPQTPREKTILSRPASAPGSRAATPKPFERSARGPTRGIFVHEDSNQAIAVTDRQTKKLTFFRPRDPNPVYPGGYNSSGNSTVNNSPRTGTVNLVLADPDTGMTFDFQPTDVMMASMDPSYWIQGPPEAFFPFVSVQNDGNIGSDEDEYDDDMDFENDVNLADFMNFGSDVDDDTDVDQGDETDVPATPATSMVVFNGSTPAQPTPTAETPTARKRSSTDAMLERLDHAGVTAFRNNQSRFRDIARLPHDPNLRASVARPVRSGHSAEAMMSPIRKRNSMSKKRPGNSAFSRVRANGLKGTASLQTSTTNPLF